MLNPYAGVNWSTDLHVVSTSHMHVPDAATFENAYTNGGIRHFAISNYKPSHPTWPLSSPVWPLVVGTIPEDIAEMPSAEHTSFTQGTYGNMHLIALGSTLESGLPEGQEPAGYQNTLDHFFAALVGTFPLGGGVVIGHPNYTGIHTSYMLKMMDEYPLILGFEIYNGSSDFNGLPMELDRWNSILATGRQCYGFFVPDHMLQVAGDAAGKNVLVVDEFTDAACADAYVSGAFYGMLDLSTLRFAGIAPTATGISASVNESSTLRLVSEQGTFAEVVGNTEITATWSASKPPIFVRVEAENAGGKIYSQPIMYVLRDPVAEARNIRRKRSLLLR